MSYKVAYLLPTPITPGQQTLCILLIATSLSLSPFIFWLPLRRRTIPCTDRAGCASFIHSPSTNGRLSLTALAEDGGLGRGRSGASRGGGTAAGTSNLSPPSSPPLSPALAYAIRDDLTLLDVDAVVRHPVVDSLSSLAQLVPSNSRRPRRQRTPARSPTARSGGWGNSSGDGGGGSSSGDSRPGTPRRSSFLADNTGGGGWPTGLMAGLPPARSISRARSGGWGALDVSPSSALWFAHRKYRVVVCLDMSASMFTERWWGMPMHFIVDATMKFIQVWSSLSRFCRPILSRLCVPSSSYARDDGHAWHISLFSLIVSTPKYYFSVWHLVCKCRRGIRLNCLVGRIHDTAFDGG